MAAPAELAEPEADIMAVPGHPSPKVHCALRAVAISVAIIVSIMTTLALSMGPSILAVVAMALVATTTGLLQAASPQRTSSATGLDRWLGAAAYLHVKALVWSLAVINAVGALRFLSGVSTVASFQMGWDTYKIDEARECGKGWITVAPRCGDVFASWLAYDWALLLHLVGAVLALLIGPWQLWPSFRNNHLALHRWMGRIYVAGILSSSVGAVVLVLHTTCGLDCGLGFLCLAVYWDVTVAFGVFRARTGDILAHRRWMTRNYAATFAAATLRVWLPALQVLMPFIDAYRIVAWLSWVPNVLLVEWYLRVAARHDTTRSSSASTAALVDTPKSGVAKALQPATAAAGVEMT